MQSIPHCEPCKVAKSTRSQRPSASEESKAATKPLELVHCDVVGPIRHPSHNNSRYFIPIYDDCTGASLVRFLKSKKESPTSIKEMILEFERAHGCKVKKVLVKRLRTDNAKEFLSSNMKKWLTEKGIVHELSAPYSPESNGKAERLNRTLMDAARSSMAAAKHILKVQKLWAEFINAANYLRNRRYNTAANDPDKTSFEAIFSKKPDMGHLRKLGSKAYVHIRKAKRHGKFTDRAELGYLVGYDSGNAYRVYMSSRHRVIVSRDVTFHEVFQSSSGNREEKVDHADALDTSTQFDAGDILTINDTEREIRNVIDVSPQNDDTAPMNTSPQPNADPIPSETLSSEEHFEDAIEHNDAQELNEEELEGVTYYPNLRRSNRESKLPKRFEPAFVTSLVMQAHIGNADPNTPISQKDAMNCKNKQEWINTMADEIEELNKYTWKLVPHPKGARPIKSKWVYAIKNDKDMKVTRHRARLVAKGFTQRHGIDYTEVFSPVAK